MAGGDEDENNIFANLSPFFVFTKENENLLDKISHTSSGSIIRENAEAASFSKIYPNILKTVLDHQLASDIESFRLQVSSKVALKEETMSRSFYFLPYHDKPQQFLNRKMLEFGILCLFDKIQIHPCTSLRRKELRVPSIVYNYNTTIASEPFSEFEFYKLFRDSRPIYTVERLFSSINQSLVSISSHTSCEKTKFPLNLPLKHPFNNQRIILEEIESIPLERINLKINGDNPLKKLKVSLSNYSFPAQKRHSRTLNRKDVSYQDQIFQITINHEKEHLYSLSPMQISIKAKEFAPSSFVIDLLQNENKIHQIGKRSAIVPTSTPQKYVKKEIDSNRHSFVTSIEDIISLQQGILPAIPAYELSLSNFFTDDEIIEDNSKLPFTKDTSCIALSASKLTHSNPAIVISNCLSTASGIYCLLTKFMKEHRSFRILFYSELYPIAFPDNFCLIQVSRPNFIFVMSVDDLRPSINSFAFPSSMKMIHIIIIIATKCINFKFYSEYLAILEGVFKKFFASYWISFCHPDAFSDLLLRLLKKHMCSSIEKCTCFQSESSCIQNSLAQFVDLELENVLFYH